ncbi:hypothetical protein K3495_g10953 [Podosphaera aphanis]|nr:hypothetical protein K3495_g10953 [Podosphaera aphanis]
MANPYDASAYYGYLFEANKQPTTILNALLRAIATYIIENIGDVEKKCLTPEKMAAFYKSVGGNYDSLFVDVPPTSISWIYTSIGCEHMLLPTDDHFIPPSIPSLTIAGFVRWQSIEILLGPEEHVPFIQTSLRLFDLKHPTTNEPFPVDLPSSAFPQFPDPEIERWHDICARQLRKWAAAAEEKHEEARSESNVKSGFMHVHSCPGSGKEDNYFDQKSPKDRPRSTYRSASRYGPSKSSSNPDYMSQKFMQSEDVGPAGVRSRRRSNPENVRTPDLQEEPEIHEIVVEEETGRHRRVRSDHTGRKSDPKQARRRSISSDASSEDLAQFRRPNMKHSNSRGMFSSDSSSGDDINFPAYAYTSRKPTSYPEPHRYNPPERLSGQVHARRKDRKKSPARTDLPTAPPSTTYSTFPAAPRPRYKEREPLLGEDDPPRRNFRIPVFLSENMPFGIGKKDEYWLRRHRNGTRGGRNLRWQDLDSTASAIREGREILQSAERHKRADGREHKDGGRGGEHGWDWDVRSRLCDTKLQKNHDDLGRADRYGDRPPKSRGLSFRERDANRRYVYHDSFGRRSPIRNVGSSHYKGG